jgi:hypothetical protein
MSDFRYADQNLDVYVPDFVSGSVLRPEMPLTPEIGKNRVFRRKKPEQNFPKPARSSEPRSQPLYIALENSSTEVRWSL